MQERRVQVRPALRGLATRVAEARLTLVVAPAGSGKTTLLACWRRELTRAGADCAWLQLSPIQDDPALFLEDLFQAVPEEAEAAPGTRLQREIPHVDRLDTHAVARRVQRALRGRTRPLHLFLDDIQRLTRDGPTDRLIDLLLREGPAELRFVMASRGARPRAAARLIAAGAALEVGADELSLRSDQVASVLREFGIDPAKVAPPLLAETRGWATGVQLAAGALARIEESEHATFIRALAQQADLFDYVAGELLIDERPETLHLLELAAVLGPADEAMLRAASPERLSVETLTRALDRGLLARNGEQLGMHPLWEEYLLRGLKSRTSAPAWRALHARIAAQLAPTDPERAMRIAGEGHAWELLTELLEKHGRGWIDRGHYHFVEDWLDRLAHSGEELSPQLTHLRALTSARRDPERAIATLEATAERLRKAGDRAGEGLALVDAGILAANENMPEATARTLRRLLSIRRLVADPDVRALSVAGLAILLVSRNRHRVALRVLRRIRRDRLAILPRATIELGLSIIGLYTDWDETLRLLDEVCNDPAHRAHAPSFFLLQAHRARTRGLRGIDPEACVAEAEESAEAFQDFRLTMSEMGAIDSVAKLHASLGRHEQACTHFERAAALAEQLGHSDYEAIMRGQLSRELLAIGQPEAALAQARRGVDVFERHDKSSDPFTFSFPAVVAYRMLAECGFAEEAHQRVQRQDGRFRCAQLPIGEHQTQLLLARIAHLAGDQEEVRRRLGQAREVVERHGLRDRGAELDPEILAWAEQSGDPPATTWRVRSLGGLQVTRDGCGIPDKAWRGATTRRLMLRLLAAPDCERRERLEADLWPDADPARAGNNLRVALSRLRKALGDDALVGEGGRVGLAGTIRAGWDVVELESALAGSGDPKRAVELLRGPFAPELFDDWAEDLRRDIELRVLSVGCRRSRELIRDGNSSIASDLARGLAGLAPLCEEAWALCAQAELAGGDRSAARRTLARARSMLDRELSVAPGRELLALENGLGRRVAGSG